CSATPTPPWRHSNVDSGSTATTTACGGRSSPRPTIWVTERSLPGPGKATPRCSATSASPRLHDDVCRDELPGTRLDQHGVGHACGRRPLSWGHHLKLHGEGGTLDEDGLVVLGGH